MPILNNAIAVLFLSFIVGLLADYLLRPLPAYRWICGRYLFKDLKTYERIGVERFRNILLATPLRLFNTTIKLPRTRDLQLLRNIQKHIATAEVSHWAGFAMMVPLTVYAWVCYGSTTGLSFVFLNIVGNLYPCLLQQYNKRRLSQLIAVMEKRIS